ncbi:MAG TPA: DUF3179 domain-containing (seleno)protein [Fimbriiglobus sp.]|jgi:hypothetical protein
MRIAPSIFVLSLGAAALPAADPPVVAKPDAFPTLVNPQCSHCVDEAKRRAGELNASDPVLCWTRGYSDGGCIPIRFFLAQHRVISDSYGVFVYDPDAGYARGFAPGYTYRFRGWRNGVMVMTDTRDGTVYSCLSGVGVEGPKKGHRLKSIPTLTSTWGVWTQQYPHAVAYHMFDKYKPVELPKTENPDSVKTRLAKSDPRLKPDELVLGVRTGSKTRAYPLSQWHGLVKDELAGEPVVLLADGRSQTAAAFRPIARQPRKFLGPKPDKDGISLPDAGTLLPPGAKELPPRTVSLQLTGETVLDRETNSHWDVAGRSTAGECKGWTLEPVDGVVCKWFAWSAEYPDTEVYGQTKPPADPKKAMKEVAGAAEFLRLLPKPFGTVKAVDPKRGTVTLLLDGDKTPKVWPVEPDAEVKINGWWGRLEQFKPGDRAWVWLKLDRHKNPKSVAMIADEWSGQEIHAAAPTSRNESDARLAKQRDWLRTRWTSEGLPGTLSVNHVFGGELDVLLDHEAIRWGRSLTTGDKVQLVADEPIQAVVKHVSPWRERTVVRLVVGELAAADLAIGRRVFLKMPPLAKELDESHYPPDIGRTRTPAERAEWFLASIYCTCQIDKEICTGQFYTLSSCNPNGCGAPGAARKEVLKLIGQGKSDTEIWDELQSSRGPLMATPHLTK